MHAHTLLRIIIINMSFVFKFFATFTICSSTDVPVLRNTEDKIIDRFLPLHEYIVHLRLDISSGETESNA